MYNLGVIRDQASRFAYWKYLPSHEYPSTDLESSLLSSHEDPSTDLESSFHSSSFSFSLRRSFAFRPKEDFIFFII
ncbi:hypothetical protein Tco_1085243 [Tanacetum coccineum]